MKIRNVQEEVKRFTRLQKTMISFIVISILLGSITLFNGSNSISGSIYNFFSLIKYSLIDYPVETITGFSTQLSELQSVYEENDELRAIIASQEMKEAELTALQSDVKELSELLDITSYATYSTLYASVINSDVSVWSHTITINKGSDDGISEDMAVISNLGLIGKITKTYANTSEVKLLTSENNDVSVSIKIQLDEDTYTTGILQYYDQDKESYIVQIYDANVEIESGMDVITSGSGGVFPSGILVGEVANIENLYNTKGLIVTVTPSVDFNAISYVAIAYVEE